MVRIYKGEGRELVGHERMDDYDDKSDDHHVTRPRWNCQYNGISGPTSMVG